MPGIDDDQRPIRIPFRPRLRARPVGPRRVPGWSMPGAPRRVLDGRVPHMVALRVCRPAWDPCSMRRGVVTLRTVGLCRASLRNHQCEKQCDKTEW